MPDCIFMHACLSPENGTDHDPRCNVAPGIIIAKAACQQAALGVHPKRPRSAPA